MKPSSSSSWLPRAVVLLAIIVWCFLLPCSAARAKGAGFNFPTGVRGEGIRPTSPKPGAPRAQNCPGCGQDYARPPPAGAALLTAPGPSKQQNCPGCGHAYAPPPAAGTAPFAPEPPKKPYCSGCGYAADALAPPAGTVLAPKQHQHAYALPPASIALAAAGLPKQHDCPGCAHDDDLPPTAGTALDAPQRKNLPGTRY